MAPSPVPPFGRRIGLTGSVAIAVVGLGLVDTFAYDKTLQRNLRTLANGAIVTIDYKWNFTAAKADHIDRLHKRVAERVARVCRQNGGLYIKFGQQIASLNHVLPAQYAEIFSKFYDEAPTVDFNQVSLIFDREFGKRPDEMFLEFDPVPIASASIAQVHRAKTRDGRQVAVKVQKPQIEKQMHWDLATFRLVSWLIEKIFDLPIYWSVGFVSERFKSEVDFINEGRNSELAMEAIQQVPLLKDRCHVPEILWDMSSPRVLTMEWIDGIKMDKPQSLEAMGYSPKEVMETVVVLFSDQIFRNGLVHCDPHPGNILIRKHPLKSPPSSSSFASRKNNTPQICLIDHGLYVQSTPNFKHDYALFWKSLFTNDLSTLTTITQGWGMRDVQLFATSTLQKPWSGKRGTSPFMSSKQKINLQEVYNFQVDGKKRIQQFFHDTELMPKELLFIGRNLNIIRSINKNMGSPVNRVNIMASYAVKSLGHDWSIWMDMSNKKKKKDHETLQHSSLPFSSFPSSAARLLFNSLSSQLNYLKFHTIMLISSLDFYWVRLRQRVRKWWMKKDGGVGHEEIMEARLKEALYQQYGIVVDERVFDG